MPGWRCPAAWPTRTSCGWCRPPVEFARQLFQAGKPAVVICHGSWTLVEADLVRGRALTSWPSPRTDIRNAGGTWVYAQVAPSRLGAVPGTSDGSFLQRTVRTVGRRGRFEPHLAWNMAGHKIAAFSGGIGDVVHIGKAPGGVPARGTGKGAGHGAGQEGQGQG